MIRFLLIVFALFFLSERSSAQFSSPERAARKSLYKKKWQKTETQLYKLIRKDSSNPIGRYLLSVYFFTKDNPSFQLDSAYSNILHAQKDLQASSQKDRERMKKFPMDSNLLVSVREKIDSAAFESYKNINTEHGYIQFLEKHPFAAQQNKAMELRDEVAFLDALNENTYKAFLNFLSKYPNASKSPEAKRNYERLLFEDKTKDRRLASFEKFLKDYPETPFRGEIEQNIFELFTMSGEPDRYVSFLQLYPSSSLRKKATDILFHILKENDELQTIESFLNDSLANVISLQKSFLVPIFKKGKFGFMDKNGAEIIPPSLDELPDEYKCGNLVDDFIAFPNKFLARNGMLFYSGKVDAFDDLGTGFIKVKTGSCYVVFHKSGFVIDRCVQDAEILGNRFLSVQKENRWQLYALNGRKLIPDSWEEIMLHGSVLGLRNENKWHLLSLNQLIEFSDEQNFSFSAPFDDVKPLESGLLWVRANAFQGILDQTLGDFIPFNEHGLSPAFFGFVAHSFEGYTIFDQSGKASSFFQKVILHQPWATVYQNGSWFLFDPESQEFKSEGYDSIKFEGPFPLGINGDSVSIHFYNKNKLDFFQPTSISFIPGKDSTSFLIVENEGKKTVYNLKGRQLFTVTYDQIQYAGNDLFIVARREKKGLINAEGKIILPLDFDAIAGISGEVISLLKGMKFGAYNILSQKLIKPQYDKNLVPYTANLLSAFQKGFYGLIDWTNHAELNFEFDEITYWNDTTAMVKRDQNWMLYNIVDKTADESGIKQIQMIRDSPAEKLAIVKTENTFGVLSNKRGIIIPLTFSDLLNLGSAEEPLYFTEKHVSEAAIFIVIYYDEKGRLLRKEVYEDSEDYEKIYCPHN